MFFSRRFCILVLLHFPLFLSAQVVNDIKIEGLNRFSKSTVMVYSAVGIGDDLSTLDIKAIINNLFITDFFDDISVNLNDEGLLYISVVEKPVISKIETTGNSSVKSEEINSYLIEQNISVGRTFNQRKVEHFKNLLLSQYTQTGHYSAEVIIAHTEPREGRVELKIIIDEGSVAKISKIVIHGNKVISDYTIKNLMVGRVSNPITSFILRNDKYSQYTLEQDTFLIERYYASHGYPDAKVLNYKASLNEGKTGIIIDIFIDEGEPKIIHNYKVEGVEDFNINKFIDDDLPMLYSIDVIDYIQKNLKRHLHDKGFYLQRLRHSIEQVDGKNIILFKVNKGDPVYLNSINITGNRTTREDIIRNHITLPEGSLFSAAKIEDIEDSLHRTGFFNAIDIKAKSNVGNSIDLNVTVEEAPTKHFTAGVQLSNISLGGELELEDKNFFGTGYTLDLKFSVDKHDKDMSFGIVNPYAFNNKYSLSYYASRHRKDYKNNNLLSNVKVDKVDHSFGLGFLVSDRTRFSSFIQYSKEFVPNKSVDAQNVSLSGPTTNDTVLSYGLRASLVTDTYNFFRFPTRGYKSKLSAYCNTPLSEFTFVDFTASLAKIFPLRRGFLFYTSGSARYSLPYGVSSKAYIPASHFLSCGGAEDVRGYEHFSLGPKFGTKIVEGNLKFVLRNELVIPNKFFNLETDAVRLSAFLDAGQMYRTYKTSQITQPRGFRYSAGLSLRWNTAILPPMSLSINLPLNKKKDQDRVEYFSIHNMIEF